MTARRIAAAATLTAVGLITASPVVVLGGLSFLGRSATWQILARSAAWMVVIPTAVVIAIGLPHGFLPPLRLLPAPLAALAALAVAGKLLEDARARATFAPLALRRWFLAAATAALAAGGALVQLGMAFRGLHLLHDAGALVGLGAMLVASGVGVARMRAWGVVLGVLSSLVAVVAASHFARGGLGWPVLTAIVPGMMMVGGILEARRRVQQSPEETTRFRVADIAEPAIEPLEAALAEPACGRLEA